MKAMLFTNMLPILSSLCSTAAIDDAYRRQLLRYEAGWSRGVWLTAPVPYPPTAYCLKVMRYSPKRRSYHRDRLHL